jgi:hypothetical protein
MIKQDNVINVLFIRNSMYNSVLLCVAEAQWEIMNVPDTRLWMYQTQDCECIRHKIVNVQDIRLWMYQTQDCECTRHNIWMYQTQDCECIRHKIMNVSDKICLVHVTKRWTNYQAILSVKQCNPNHTIRGISTEHQHSYNAEPHLCVSLLIHVPRLSHAPGHAEVCNLAHLVVVYQNIACCQVSMDYLRSQNITFL